MKAISKLHSFIDVITNSSSELFINGDKRIIEFFREVLKDKTDGLISITKFKDFAKDHYLDEFKEDNPEKYEEEYGSFSDEDDILVCYYESEELEYTLAEFLESLNFKSIY